MTVKEEISELQKEYIRAGHPEPYTIHLPRTKARDLITQERNTLRGVETPDDLAKNRLFGMQVVLTNDKGITLSS